MMVGIGCVLGGQFEQQGSKTGRSIWKAPQALLYKGTGTDCDRMGIRRDLMSEPRTQVDGNGSRPVVSHAVLVVVYFPECVLSRSFTRSFERSLSLVGAF